MAMKKVLFSHFYNEEYLLPYWLEWHREMFDHGVMFDYQSSDRSVEIIRSMCPTWEILPSENGSTFVSGNLEPEIMREEERFPGAWKMVLNITEFLMVKDLDAVLDNVPDDVNRVITHGACFVSPEYGETICEEPFMKQFHHGIFPYPKRYRLIHRNGNGGYVRGRHAFDLLHGAFHLTDELIVVGCDYGPLNDDLMKRKTQFADRIPEIDRRNGWGINHVWPRERILEEWELFKQTSGDLLNHPAYREIYEHRFGSI